MDVTANGPRSGGGRYKRRRVDLTAEEGHPKHVLAGRGADEGRLERLAKRPCAVPETGDGTTETEIDGTTETEAVMNNGQGQHKRRSFTILLNHRCHPLAQASLLQQA